MLSSIAQTGEPLTPYLNVWTETTTRATDEHLIQFVTMYGTGFANGESFNDGFWRDAKLQALELHRWVLQPETLQRIMRVAYLLSNDGLEHLFRPRFRHWRQRSVGPRRSGACKAGLPASSYAMKAISLIFRSVRRSTAR